MKSGVVRGSLAFTAARLMGALCSLALVWFISRIGDESLGAFRTIFAFFLFTDFLPLLGMQHYVIREVSTHHGQVRKYLLHAVLLAGAVSVVAIIGLVLVAGWGKYSSDVRTGLLIVAAGLPATALTLSGQSVLVGLGHGATYARLQFGEAILRSGVGLALILLGAGILPVVAVLVATRWLILVGYWRCIAPYARGERWRLDLGFFREFVSHVPIFASIMGCFLVIRFAAQMMLPWMKGDAEAGQFATAYVFLDIGLLLPTAFAANVMPLFAQKFALSAGEFARYCRMAIKLIALVILPFVVTVSVMAEPIMLAVFNTSYLPAVPALRLLIWVCFLMAIDQILSTAIISCQRQKIDLYSVAVGAASMIVLLRVLIDRSGTYGAALGTLSATGVLLAARFVLVGRHIPGLNPMVLLWRPALAAAGMAATMLYVPLYHWVLQCVAGVLVYAALSLLTGSFSAAERRSMIELLRADAGKRLSHELEKAAVPY